MPPVQIVEVTPAEAGQKLLQFLERRLGRDLPRSALMRWIRTGQVRVDGRRAKPFDRLDAGQAVRIPPHTVEAVVGGDGMAAKSRPASGRAADQDGGCGLDIVFQDPELLVLAKPAGLPTQPGSGWTDSVSTRLKLLGGDFAATPAHRLDKDTSGLLLAARTYGCLRRLQDLLKDRLAGKIYLAWVAGRLAPGAVLVLRDLLAKAGSPGREKVRTGAGKEALAEALPLLIRAVPGGQATLVAIRLLTGRTHQIRVQLASRDHPIIGDRKYGGPDHGRLMLHAWRLDLPERTFTLLPDWTGTWKVRETDLEAVARTWAAK